VKAQDDLRRYKLLVDKARSGRADLRPGAGGGQVQHGRRLQPRAPMKRRRKQFIEQARSRQVQADAKLSIGGDRAAAGILHESAGASGDRRCPSRGAPQT